MKLTIPNQEQSKKFRVKAYNLLCLRLFMLHFSVKTNIIDFSMIVEIWAAFDIILLYIVKYYKKRMSIFKVAYLIMYVSTSQNQHLQKCQRSHLNLFC